MDNKYISEIDCAAKGDLLSLAATIKHIVIDDNINTTQAIDIILNKLYKINIPCNSDIDGMNSAIDNTISYINDRKSEDVTGQTTGSTSLDKRINGLNSGELIVIGSRPAIGKTSFAVNIALANLEKNDGVLYFSLDRPKALIILNMISIKTNIPFANIMYKKLTAEETTIFNKELNELRNKQLFIDDSRNLNLNQFKYKVKKMVSQKANNIKLVILDYIQAIKYMDNNKKISEAKISNMIKSLANEIKIPIVVLSQINRKLEFRNDKRPKLSDIKKFSSLEEDANTVMFLYRDDIYKKRNEFKKEIKSRKKGGKYKSAFIYKSIEDVEIIIAKHNNKRLCTVNLTYDKNCMKFEDGANHEFL